MEEDVMPNRSHACCALLIASVLLACGIASSAPEVVYSNTDVPTTDTIAPDGFVYFNRFDPAAPMGDELIGDEIILARTERYVTQFDLLLSSSEPTTLSLLTLTLRNNDGIVWSMGGYPEGPGTEIWTGTLSNVSVIGATTVVFNLPRVLVPDRFTWMVAADSNVAGPATYAPPKVGLPSPDFMDCLWDIDSATGDIYAIGLSKPPSDFGAAILAEATPEPASAALLLLGGGALLRRRRR